MEVRLDTQALSTLSSEKVIRCFYKVRCRTGSRRGRDVIPWAKDISVELGAAISKVIGVEAASPDTQPLMIVIYGNKPRALICFDYYTKGCDGQTRENITNRLERPIYQIHERSKMIYINRNQKLDKHIAAQLTQTSSYDRGPLPFFKDEDNPTIYDDGRRVEYDEVAQTMDGDDSESSEVDDTTPELEHKDQDVKPKEAQVDQPAVITESET